jgi:hypothetical protein
MIDAGCTCEVTDYSPCQWCESQCRAADDEAFADVGGQQTGPEQPESDLAALCRILLPLLDRMPVLPLPCVCCFGQCDLCILTAIVRRNVQAAAPPW